MQVVSNQVFGSLAQGRRFAELLNDSSFVRCPRHPEVNHAAGVQLQDEKDESLLEEQINDGQEIEGPDIVRVGLQECRPSLIGSPGRANGAHILMNRAFQHIVPSFNSSPWMRPAPQRRFSFAS